MTNSFVALETLYVHFRNEMKEIVGRGELVKEEGMASKFLFRELRRSKLIGLSRFKKFCSQSF